MVDLVKIVKDKRNLHNYISNPTAEGFEKVKHLKLLSSITGKAVVIKPTH